MQFAMSCRQPAEYLEKADILVVQWEDRKGLIELGHKYKDKTFVLLTDSNYLNAQELSNYNIFCRNNLVCGIQTEEQLLVCQEVEIKFYFFNFLFTFEQAQNAKKAGACWLKIASPLVNNLKKVKKLGLPIITILNSTFSSFPTDTINPCGNWFRPEDYDYYTQYIDIGFFAWRDLAQERALYRIYAENKEWIGNLKDLIYGLNYEGKNHLIPPTLAERRGSCDQACKKNGTCALCIHTLQLANPDLLKQIKRKNQEE